MQIVRVSFQVGSLFVCWETNFGLHSDILLKGVDKTVLLELTL